MYRSLLIAAMLAVSAGAQSHSLQVNLDPLNPVWGNSLGDNPGAFQMRTVAEAGGWSIPTYDAFAVDGPWWLQSPAHIAFDHANFGVERLTGSAANAEVHSDVMAWFIDRLTKDPATNDPAPTMVISRCAAHIQESLPVVWDSSPAMWSAPEATWGASSIARWSNLNHPDYSITNMTTAFSAEAMFRDAVIRRATLNSLPTSEADNFFHSNYYYQQATGTSSGLKLRIQSLYLRDPYTVLSPTSWQSATPLPSIPTLPPLASLTTSMSAPIILSAPDPSRPINDLGGTQVTLDIVPFTVHEAIPPLTVEFQKQGGGTVKATGYSAVTVENPLRYVVQIPANAAPGLVTVTDRREAGAVGTAVITAIVP